MSDQLHILFLPSWYPSSAEDYTGCFFREHALELAKAGVKVGIIAASLRSLRKPSSILSWGNQIQEENDCGVKTLRASLLHSTPMLPSLTAKRISNLVLRLYDLYARSEGDPHLLHLHSAVPLGSGALAITSKRGVPFVVSEHSSSFARRLLSNGLLSICRNVSMNARLRFAVSRSLARVLESTIGVPRVGWGVMPNMVGSEFLRASLAARRGDRFRFLHVSTLDENKNPALIIKAFAEAFGQNANAELIIAGGGDALSQLRKLSHELGISDRIAFPGQLTRKQVIQQMQMADAFVLASKIETFSVVLIEALALGLPVIAPRCGGPEDIVGPEVGLLVSEGQRDELVTAMTSMYQNPESWCSVAIRDYCQRRFGPDVLSRQWIGIYREALRPQSTF